MLNFFLTFVLKTVLMTVVMTVFTANFGGLALAAPTTNVTPEQYNQNAPPNNDHMRRPLERDSLATPELKPAEVGTEDHIFATRTIRDKTFNVAVGLWSGPLKEKGDSITAQVFSITQTHQQPNEAAYEFGFDLTTSEQFGPHGQFKKYCCLGAHFEPYWSAGIQGLYKPSEQLAGFVKMDSYQAMVGGGVEDFLNLNRRVRLEGLLGLGTRGTTLLIRIGYAFDEDIDRIF
ncbi:MAG: hypothetical protein ACK5P7_12635 [Bdellovibrio sp.]